MCVCLYVCHATILSTILLEFCRSETDKGKARKGKVGKVGKVGKLGKVGKIGKVGTVHLSRSLAMMGERKLPRNSCWPPTPGRRASTTEVTRICAANSLQ